MMPRHGTAEAMAMGLQGALPGVPRWGLGEDDDLGRWGGLPKARINPAQQIKALIAQLQRELALPEDNGVRPAYLKGFWARRWMSKKQRVAQARHTLRGAQQKWPKEFAKLNAGQYLHGLEGLEGAALPPPEQQGENVYAAGQAAWAALQGKRALVPVAKPGATPEEQKRIAELAALAKQGEQTGAGLRQLSQRLDWKGLMPDGSGYRPPSNTPPPAKPLPPWVVPVVAAGVIGLLVMLGKKG